MKKFVLAVIVSAQAFAGSAFAFTVPSGFVGQWVGMTADAGIKLTVETGKMTLIESYRGQPSNTVILQENSFQISDGTHNETLGLDLTVLNAGEMDAKVIAGAAAPVMSLQFVLEPSAGTLTIKKDHQGEVVLVRAP